MPARARPLRRPKPPDYLHPPITVGDSCHPAQFLRPQRRKPTHSYARI